MNIATILQLLLMLSIILLLFALALRARAADLPYLVTHWRIGLGAIIAMFVMVPLAAIVLAAQFPLATPVKIALVAVAFSPMPPVLPGKQVKAGAETCYITGLLFGTSLASVIIAPFGISLAAHLLGAEAELSAGDIFAPVAITLLLPLLLGLAGSRLLGGRVDTVSRVAGRIGSVIMVLAFLGLLILLLPGIIEIISAGALAVLVAMILVGLVSGFALGGRDRGDRAALALAASTRHPGVALAIANNAFPDAQFVAPAIVLSLILSTLISIPFMQYLSKTRSEAA